MKVSARRRLKEQAQAARARLQEAALAMDGKLLSEQVASAVSEGAISEQEGARWQEELNASVHAAEEPLRREVLQQAQLPEEGAAAAKEEDDGVESRLRALLAESKLPSSNVWYAAALDLLPVLEALAELRRAAAEAAAEPESPDALQATVQLGFAAGVRSECGLRRLEATLKVTGCFEESRAERLWRKLEEGRAAAAAAERDLSLWQTVSSWPWASSSPQLSQLSAKDLEELEARATAASTAGRARVAEALEEALERGRCAVALQQALESQDCPTLTLLLPLARQLGFSGLDVVQQRLDERESALSELQGCLEGAIEILDAELFQEQLDSAYARGVQLPRETESELRETLERKVAEAEAPFRQLVESRGPGEATLAEVLSSSILPYSSSWRSAAEAINKALQGVAAIESAKARISSSDLQEALAIAAHATGPLKDSLERVGYDDGNWTSILLEEAMITGSAGLPALKADEALCAALESPPWNQRPLSLPDVGLSDVMELEEKAALATEAGQAKMLAAVEAALAMGRGAVAVWEAMAGDDPEQLAAKIREAKDLGLRGLALAEQRQREMHAERRRAEQAERLQEQRREREAEAERQRAERQRAERQRAERQRAERQQEQQASKQRVLEPSMEELAAAPGWKDAGAESSNIIFLDLELTAGFYDFDAEPRVLEAAIVVTDADLREKARGTWVIGDFTRADLEGLSEFHQAHFRDAVPGGRFPPRLHLGSQGNGLFSDVLDSQLTRRQVEAAMLNLIRKHCPPGACPLAGYSVQCDREVLRVEMPRLYRHLSHQIVDVSGFFRLARLRVPEKIKLFERRISSYNHRALNDAEDSIEALRWIQEQFFQPAPAPKAHVAPARQYNGAPGPRGRMLHTRVP